MTIEQAIEHCEEVATHCGIKECEEEHLQLADWLKELQKYKQDAFDKLQEDLKAEKEKYNEAIQYCNKIENKYKTMINNFIRENR